MPSLTAARGVLRDIFGYEAFRPGQAEIIGSVLAGRNTLAVLPTGGGKSLCYQIPALLADGVTLVISPLISLMRDQVAALEANGVAAASLSSGNSADGNTRTLECLERGELRLLFLSPERLLSGGMTRRLQRLRISLIAVDEAHCLSQWGHDFRKDYLDLERLPDLFPGTPCLALTATADEATRGEIVSRLFRGEARTFVSGFDRPNIRFGITPKQDAKRQVLDFLSRHQGESGIVYCLSRRKVEEMAAFLSSRNIPALPYHAGMDAAERAANQDRFLREDGIVIVATIAFGMGIDKPDVRFVLHADLPGSVENWYQEMGRAGRDGAPAEALMLYGLNDIHQRRRMIHLSEKPEETKRVDRRRLDALLAICEAAACRRRALLAYFGENIEACGNCDLCLDPVAVTDGTVAAQKVLSAVYRTGQRFGAAHIIDVLAGRKTAKVGAFGHDRLPTFGVGADLPVPEWRSIIRQMLAAGVLEQDLNGHGGLALTGASRPVLRGESSFPIRKESSARPPRRRERREAADDAVPLSAEDRALFERLKTLRVELAREGGIPAYVIFHDRTLMEMARRRPATLEALSGIHGVGETKLARFGEKFLRVLAAG